MPPPGEAALYALCDQLHEQRATGDPVREPADRVPASRPSERPGAWEHAELMLCIDRARSGDATSARRAAELFELADDLSAAREWWRLAADLGDADAIDYVRFILTG